MSIIKDFPTIDLCVDFLVNEGCEWDHKKETELNEKHIYKYNEYIVIYDKYEILKIK